MKKIKHTSEHMPNNWLKNHGYPMRRKPYGKHKLKKENLKIAKEMVNKPFELQDELTSARNRQKEINKILDTSGNENSKVVVEDDLEEERNESCMEL